MTSAGQHAPVCKPSRTEQSLLPSLAGVQEGRHDRPQEAVQDPGDHPEGNQQAGLCRQGGQAAVDSLHRKSHISHLSGCHVLPDLVAPAV